MSKAGARLIKGAREAVAIARGDLMPARLWQGVEDEHGKMVEVKGDDAKRELLHHFKGLAPPAN